MKKHKLSESQIVKLLQEGASGHETIEVLCRRYGVSEATYYGLKS
jgi:putative transposase